MREKEIKFFLSIWRRECRFSDEPHKLVHQGSIPCSATIGLLAYDLINMPCLWVQRLVERCYWDSIHWHYGFTNLFPVWQVWRSFPCRYLDAGERINNPAIWCVRQIGWVATLSRWRKVGFESPTHHHKRTLHIWLLCYMSDPFWGISPSQPKSRDGYSVIVGMAVSLTVGLRILPKNSTARAVIAAFIQFIYDKNNWE